MSLGTLSRAEYNIICNTVCLQCTQTGIKSLTFDVALIVIRLNFSGPFAFPRQFIDDICSNENERFHT